MRRITLPDPPRGPADNREPGGKAASKDKTEQNRDESQRQAGQTATQTLRLERERYTYYLSLSLSVVTSHLPHPSIYSVHTSIRTRTHTRAVQLQIPSPFRLAAQQHITTASITSATEYSTKRPRVEPGRPLDPILRTQLIAAWATGGYCRPANRAGTNRRDPPPRGTGWPALLEPSSSQTHPDLSRLLTTTYSRPRLPVLLHTLSTLDGAKIGLDSRWDLSSLSDLTASAS